MTKAQLLRINRLLALVFLSLLPYGTVAQSLELEQKILFLAPPTMSTIQLTPRRLDTSNDVSMLYYRIANHGPETVYGIRWAIFFTDHSNKLIHNESWWDRGQWKAGSQAESETVFKYDGSPDVEILILPLEIHSASGVRVIEERDIVQSLPRIIKSKSLDGIKARFVLHVKVSRSEQTRLIQRALNMAITDPELKQALGLNESNEAVLLMDNQQQAFNVPNLKPVGSEQVREWISQGIPINYFAPPSLSVNGSNVRVILNYHRPSVSGNTYVDKGVRLSFVYEQKNYSFALRAVEKTFF